MKVFARADETRILELLADRAAFGLSSEEAAELMELSRLAPDFDTESIDRTAAVVEIAFAGVPGATKLEDLPESLREKVAVAAARHLGIKESGVRSQGSGARGQEPDALGAGLSTPPLSRKSTSKSIATNWLVLAASVLVAVGVFYAVRSPGKSDPEQAYRTLLSASNTASAEIVKAAWIDPAKPDDSKPHGDIVWSGLEQRGYMRLRNLTANDPKQEQYQLWIFDTAQDERYPIDGGVFDIDAAERDANGDVVVPINAKLKVTKPTMFAISIEKPGGVVVSSRERLPLLAKVN